MSNHVSLITGGNSGIGSAAAAQLAKQGSHVVIACRSSERGERALADLKRETGSEALSLLVMDMSSRDSIVTGCESYRGLGRRHLDVLIHNAADFDISRKTPVLSADGVETVWATNHVGPVLLTQLLDPELSASDQARVITVSSQGLVLHPRLEVRLDDPAVPQRGIQGRSGLLSIQTRPGDVHDLVGESIPR